jgi:branched-chain amino acid transport system ATP-binding protein
VSSGLDLVDVRAGYGPIEVLHGVSLSFPLGSVVALLGRNGSGKSSVLRAVDGTIPVSSGQVTWRRRDITRWTVSERVAAEITVVPVGANVFAGLTVADNLALFAHGLSLDPVYACFPELADKGAQRAGTLSGGERQMLAVARLLLRPGAALLLDEVTQGLSVGAIDRLHGVIDDLATPERVIVVAEQYQPDIARRADLVYVLSRGDVVWAGDAAELSSGPPPGVLR